MGHGQCRLVGVESWPSTLAVARTIPPRQRDKVRAAQSTALWANAACHIYHGYRSRQKIIRYLSSARTTCNSELAVQIVHFLDK